MKSNLVRVRFGVTLPIFKNAAAVVFYAPDTGARNLVTAVEVLRSTLVSLGQQAFADRLICSITN